ncbi:MAG: hypothetical protein KDB90_12895 [Planctomycetes bacterium]|nr:hypothetical protein [Planctomycetota bacterium]
MRFLLVSLVLGFVCSAAHAALVVTPVSGSTLQVPSYFTGNGNGFAMGAFEITSSNGKGHVLESITLKATSGGAPVNGDDSTAFSEIGLFLDVNSNGLYDPSVDTRYGFPYTAYPADDASLTFAARLGIPSVNPQRFLIVAKLNGVVPPYLNAAFHTVVENVVGTGGPVVGVPTSVIPGVSPVNGSTSLRLEYSITGSAPSYDYAFRLVLDNHDGSWAAGQQWDGPIFGQATFENPGSTPFANWATNATSYPIGTFDATYWSGVGVAGSVYYAPVLIGPGFANYWEPTSVGDELTWWGTTDVFLIDGEMAWTAWRYGLGPTALGSSTLEPAHRVGDYLRVNPIAGSFVDVAPAATGTGSGFVIGVFDVISHTNSATLSSLTLAASGSGDDSTAFSDVRLFVDTNSNGAYDPGVDTQFGQTYSAYPADDGSLTFTDTLNFNPDETKRLLVVVKLNGSTLASYGQTFDTAVTAISATGNMHSGLPTATMPGIHIEAPTLTLSTSAGVTNVAADAQGPADIGVQAAEFLLANNAVGAASLDSITIAAAGSLFDHTGFSSVALFEDTNSNGAYDAADTLYAAATSAFPTDDGSLTFSQSISFAPGQSRLFLLVLKLSGSGQVGDDFWARVTVLGVSGGTETANVPGTLVECLNIDTAGTTPPPSTGSSNNDSGCSTGTHESFWLLALALACIPALRRRARA